MIYNNDNLIDKDCTLLCGVPLGGLPICSYISTKYEIPMIMVRDNVKSYGTNKQIEGIYNKKDKCVIIEDVVTTGGSVNKIIDILKDKVDIIGVVVVLNRQESYNCSIPIKSVTTKTDIMKAILSSGWILNLSGNDCSLAHSRGVSFLICGPNIGIILAIATRVGV